MAVTRYVRFRREGEPYGTVFNPETDHYLTPEEQVRAKGAGDNNADPTKDGYRVEYVGKVLGTFEKNGYNDSDFCAYVEKPDGTFGAVEYASTRGWTYLNHAEVDATQDVHERYWAYRDKVDAERAEAREAAEVEVARVGKAVKVVKGKHKGVEGVVGWLGQSAYGGNRWNGGGTWRVRVDTEGGEKVFVPLANTNLPEHENLYERIGWALAEGFRGAPQTRGSRVTAS